MSWLKIILAALFGAVMDAFHAWRKDRAAETAMRDAAMLDVLNTIDSVIKEIADDRSKLRPASDAGVLAHRLRDRAINQADKDGAD